MNTMNVRQLVVRNTSGVLTLAILTANASAGDYTFINIADTTGQFSNLISTPAINDAGQVAFHGYLDAGPIGVFRSDGDVPNQAIPIADTAGLFGFQFHWVSAAPAINDLGQVAIQVQVKTTLKRRIYVGDGTGLTLIAQTDTPPFGDLSEDVSINNSGVVAFEGGVVNGWHGIYIGSGGPTTTLYQNDQGVFSSFGEATINDNGVVAFTASKIGLGLGVFSGAGGAVTTLADTSGPLNGFNSRVAFNDNGTAAFYALLDRGGVAVYTSSGGAPELVANSSGGLDIAMVTVGPSLNNAGTTAFYSPLDSLGVGIFTGPDPATDTVIKAGDPLFGSTCEVVDFSHKGINSHGDIAFRYVLSNGVIGIAVAKAPQSALEGDVNGDGAVNGADLGLLLSAWGTNDANADLNNDGVVDGTDLGLLLAGWTG